jgi:hypothetical protein
VEDLHIGIGVGTGARECSGVIGCCDAEPRGDPAPDAINLWGGGRTVQPEGESLGNSGAVASSIELPRFYPVKAIAGISRQGKGGLAAIGPGAPTAGGVDAVLPAAVLLKARDSDTPVARNTDNAAGVARQATDGASGAVVSRVNDSRWEFAERLPAASNCRA